MAASGSKTGRLPEPPFAVQIGDTLHRSESRVSHGFQRFTPSFTRTVLSLVRLFVTNMNSFYTGKCVQFSLQTGLAVFSGGGTRLKLNMLSSGEKQLLLLFCNTLIARDRSAIFIIDEPELSLNVKWQRRLVKALLDCIEGSNIQFLLATHSLEILALHRNNVAKLVNASPEGSK